MVFGISEYISTGLLVTLLGGGWFHESRVSNLEQELTIVGIELNTCKTNNYTLNAALIKQNNVIKQNKINIENKNRNAQTEKIKLNKIIKNLKKVKSNECKDIKNTLNAVRSYDFNSL